jgi:pyridoxal phosphate-dependent aminotransferase EpsN
MIYLSSPDMTDAERAALIDAFDSGWIAPVGPDLTAFEAEMCAYLGLPEGGAAALSSGTAGLHLALRLAGVGPGDEVWTSTMTFIATANAVSYQGATPVFLDVDPATWRLDPGVLAQALEVAAATDALPAALVTVDL